MKLNLVLIAAAICLTGIVAQKPFPPALVAQDQPATAPLQKQLDDQARTLTNVVAALDKLEAAKPADPATVTATELGCKTNDPRFDNGPLIQAALDKMLSIEFDASGTYYTSPLKTTGGQSNVIKGGSAGYRHGAKGATILAAFKPDQTHILELAGDPTKSNGQVQVVRDLSFLGSDKCDGIRVHGGRSVSIENCTVRLCRKGIVVQPAISCYATSIRGCSILNCELGIELNNATSVCCFAVYSTEVMGGKTGVHQIGWKRGAIYTAVVCEGQTEDKFKLDNARATFIGVYLEGDPGAAGLWMRSSKLTVIDSSIGGYKHSGDSQITWVGDNVASGTRAYP